MDRIDTLVAKITAVDRFNNGAVNLMNVDETLTGLFNGFIRYLLDEWSEPISDEEAPEVAIRLLHYLKRAEGVKTPSRSNIEYFLTNEDSRLLPVLAVRWLMRNAHVRVCMPYLTEWTEFARRYQAVLAACDVGLFQPAENDQ